MTRKERYIETRSTQCLACGTPLNTYSQQVIGLCGACKLAADHARKGEQKSISIQLSPQMREALRAFAKERRVRASTIITEALANYLPGYEPTKGEGPVVIPSESDLGDYVLIEIYSKEGPLYAKVSPEDRDSVIDYRWHLYQGRAARTTLDPVNHYRRRLYLGQQIMNVPMSVRVRHLNGDRLDCRRANLSVIGVPPGETRPSE